MAPLAILCFIIVCLFGILFLAGVLAVIMTFVVGVLAFLLIFGVVVILACPFIILYTHNDSSSQIQKQFVKYKKIIKEYQKAKEEQEDQENQLRGKDDPPIVS